MTNLLPLFIFLNHDCLPILNYVVFTPLLYILGTTVVLGVDRNGGLNGTSAGGDDVLLVQQFNR